VNDYAKVLINIFETTLKGKGFSHEVKKQLEYLKWIQTDIKTKEIIQADTISQVKLLAKKNLVSAENLNEKFIGSMDEMCEKYARVYGSNCNLQ